MHITVFSEDIDYVCVGTVIQEAKTTNIAREVGTFDVSLSSKLHTSFHSWVFLTAVSGVCLLTIRKEDYPVTNSVMVHRSYFIPDFLVHSLRNYVLQLMETT